MEGTSRLLALAALSLVVACAVPHRDYSVAQIEKVDNLEELMDVQATVIDPWFGRIGGLEGGALSDADWARLDDAGTRLRVTAARVAEFSEGEADFERFNDAVAKGATDLLESVRARDRAKVESSLRRMRKGCRDCHAKYR